MELEEKLYSFTLFLKDSSLSCFQQQTGDLNLKVMEENSFKENEGLLWYVTILIGNSDFHLTFNVCFRVLEILALSPEIFNDVDDTKLAEEVRDFMREYNNLFAGLIKGNLLKQGIKAKFSLPMITKRYDKCFSLGGKKASEKLQQKWIIGRKNLFIECSFLLDILNPEIENSLLRASYEKGQDSKPEVDFL